MVLFEFICVCVCVRVVNIGWIDNVNLIFKIFSLFEVPLFLYLIKTISMTLIFKQEFTTKARQILVKINHC